MKRSGITKIVIPAIVVVMLGFAVYYFGFRKTSTTTTEQTKTVKVTKGDIKPALTATGTVGSENETGVNFETGGELTEVNVKVGDVVTAGQQLAKIDATSLEREVTIAKANLNGANAKLSQVKSQPNADSYDVRIQQAAVTQAKENYEAALENVEKATLVSPTAGTVLGVNASVGEQVSGVGSTASSSQSGSAGSGTSGTSSGQSSSSSASSSSSDFIVVADLTKLQIEVSIDQVDLPKVAKDQSVSISFDAIPNQEFSGKIVNIDPTPVNTQNVITYNILTSIDNPDPKIQLGMTADLDIDLGAKKDVLVVPNLAVRAQDGSKVVRKMIDGAASDVPVEVGLSDDTYTEIVSGLSEGDQIVVNVFTSTEESSQTQGQGGDPPMMFRR